MKCETTGCVLNSGHRTFDGTPCVNSQVTILKFTERERQRIIHMISTMPEEKRAAVTAYYDGLLDEPTE